MKEIKFIFREGFKDVEQFVNAELERISPYLKRTIRALYDLNWPEEGEFAEDVNLPQQVSLTIPFRNGMPTDGPSRRVFNFVFFTDYSDIFELYVDEWGNQEEEESVASASLKFSDWLEVEG